ncbi:MAG TPA: hypothetical protein VIW67_25145 [Terriglobales bacterium]|jgi:xanthine/uracil permease
MGIFKGTFGMVCAAVMLVVLLVAYPAYRWFILVCILISLGIGLVVWGILYFWNRAHPIEEKDVQNTKHPLGLS